MNVLQYKVVHDLKIYQKLEDKIEPSWKLSFKVELKNKMAHEWAGSSNIWVKIDYERDLIRIGLWTWYLLKSGGQNLVELKIELQSGA